MTAPYYEDETVRLFLGDCQEVLPALGETFDAAVCDPPYVATSLAWDSWPDGWPAAVAAVTSSMWCFGSLRMFLRRGQDLAAAGWKLSHDTIGEFEVDTGVWEKHRGTGFQTDRFRNVHELMAHWYRGAWGDVHHDVPRDVWYGTNMGHVTRSGRRAGVDHTGTLAAGHWVDTGTRIAHSVIHAKSVRRDMGGIHPTQKPVSVITPLIEYAAPLGSLVLDPMAGSCSTAVAARLLGRRVVCIEIDEAMCEKAARRLDQGLLTFDGGGVS